MPLLQQAFFDICYWKTQNYYNTSVIKVNINGKRSCSFFTDQFSTPFSIALGDPKKFCGLKRRSCRILIKIKCRAWFILSLILTKLPPCKLSLGSVCLIILWIFLIISKIFKYLLKIQVKNEKFYTFKEYIKSLIMNKTASFDPAFFFSILSKIPHGKLIQDCTIIHFYAYSEH